MRTVSCALFLLVLACGDSSGSDTGLTTTGLTTTELTTTGLATTGLTTTGDTSSGASTVGSTDTGNPPTTGEATDPTPGSTSATGDTSATGSDTSSSATDSDTSASASDSGSSTGDVLPCSEGEQQACFGGDPEQQGKGLCKAGVSTCDDVGMWGPCVGEVLPAAESCESPGDEDCDGVDPCGGKGEYKWHKYWGANSDERGVRVGFDATGALIVAAQGASSSDFGGGALVSAGSWDLYLAKFAPDGAHVWSKRYGDSAAQFGDGWSLAVDPGGEFVVAGGFQGKIDLGGGPLSSMSIADIFLARFKGDGSHVWSKSFKSSSYALSDGLGIDGDGEVYLAGYFTGSLDLGGGQLVAPGLSKDGFVAKFTAAGGHVWSQRFGDTQNQEVHGLAVDAAGNATIAGYFAGTMNPGNGQLVSAGSDDAFVVRYDTVGNAVWAKRFGDGKYQQVLALARSPDGRVTIAGRFEGSVDFGGGPLLAPSQRGFVAQFEPDGKPVWSKLIASGAVQPQSIAADGFGTLVATGFFTGMADFGGGALVSEGGDDIFVVKLGPAGTHVWSRRFGDNAQQQGLGAAASADGTSAIVGGFYGGVNFGGGPGNSKGGLDGFLAVFKP